MDFEFSPEADEAATLAARILSDRATPERMREVEAGGDRFDRQLWGSLGEAGLLGLALPEEHGGAGLGLIEACRVLVEVGRRVAPLPLATHLAASRLIAELGSPGQQEQFLPWAATGASVLTAALAEERSFAPGRPGTTARSDGSGWLISGTKAVVPAGTVADVFLVPATTDDGDTDVFVLTADEVTITAQQLSDGDAVARIDLLDVPVGAERRLAGAGERLRELATLAACAQQLGVTEGALELTSTYARTREQFGRPIGTFQAVSQRLADAYIDTLGQRLTLWQAAWRLEEGLPATTELAIAKLFAADAGHAVAHTTVHVHGGVGIDLDGEAHRYFTAAKRWEFTHGGTTEQALTIGRALASAVID
ncbi:acyl-CoA dehydrogenase family protein [Nocardioides piscis]|uniref:Acyl-CoA/acyl-ACP dehydrogenase n=1 Tax=Nocardioides piscis TaxID=2714938 RepID=A0A6G7YIT9_9ACTN|nr:acyl-CoA dehydrogenase family protein [Nocardioides piscis]QIK76655.1 acyl-CoA/acyl-ACP dehydrogenase [Nocardioides piscis]